MSRAATELTFIWSPGARSPPLLTLVGNVPAGDESSMRSRWERAGRLRDRGLGAGRKAGRGKDRRRGEADFGGQATVHPFNGRDVV